MHYLLWKRNQLDGLVEYFKNGKFKEIHNLNDNELGEVTCVIIQKIHDYVSILESEYGTDKYQTIEEVEANLGGFIAYIEDTEDGRKIYSILENKYHICQEEAEISEAIIKIKNDDGINLTWWFELYCFTDFNIVIINSSNNSV